MKWTGKGEWPPEQEKLRRRVLEEARAHREYRKRLREIKTRLDLYGEAALTDEEMLLVKKHHDFFFPEER